VELLGKKEVGVVEVQELDRKSNSEVKELRGQKS